VGSAEGPATATERVETQSAQPGAQATAAAFATAAQRALTNPMASRALISSAGFKRAGSSANANATGTSAVDPTPSAQNSDYAEPAVSVGRVAAAAQAFSAAASPPKHAKPPAPTPAQKRTELSGLVPQKVRGRAICGRVGGFTSYPAAICLPVSLSLSLSVGCSRMSCAKIYGLCGATRNSEMSTCRPRVRCSAPYAGRPPQRTHLPRRRSRHLRSQRKKAVFLRPPCAVPPRHRLPRMCLNRSQSQKRSSNISLKGETKRKRLGSGQRHYMIIGARWVCAPNFSPFRCECEALTPWTCLLRCSSRSQAICIYERARGCSSQNIPHPIGTHVSQFASLRPKATYHRNSGGLEKSAVGVGSSLPHM
jgi:hypothetical protein